MISNAADYDYVTGITNGEVVIDGGIMPARDVASNPQGIMQPECLRGEDVAFLAECAGERNTVMEAQSQQPHAYSRSITASQLGGISTNLARYIRSPQTGTDGLYIKPDYAFSVGHITPTLAEVQDMLDLQTSLLTAVYPTCGYVSPAASGAPNPFVGDDVRAMFYDAENTRLMIPDPNVIDISQSWPPTPQGNITSVQISDTLTEHRYNYNGAEPQNPAFASNSLQLHVTNQGGGNNGGYWAKARSLTSFAMSVQIPSAIRSLVASHVTAIVQVYGYQAIVNTSGGETMYYDLWGFPFSKTADANGVVSFNYTDYQSIISALDQNIAAKGFSDYGWFGNNLMRGRLDYILACPLVLSLTSHTDFSSFGWTWTPPAP